MNFSKGEYKIIYKKQGNIFGCYHVNIIGQDKRYLTVIDLNDKEIEKTFNITRVIEVLDKSSSENLVQERLNKHKKDYKNRELPSSFVHGGFFSKERGYIDSDGTLVLQVKGSKSNQERDLKVLKLLIYYWQIAGKTSMGECKKFMKNGGAGILGYDSNDEFDDYDFTAEGKKDLLDGYKDEINDNKDYLKELIQNCKDDGDNPVTSDDVISLKKEIESQQKYLKIVRSDYRQELINYFCRDYYHKHKDGIFYDIMRDFPIEFEEG
jgi:hypothetical protein